MKRFVLMFLFFSQIVYAKNHIVILGGGGEEKSSNKTIFDNDLVKLGSYVNNRKPNDTNVDIAFNGGHAFTEDIIKNRFPFVAAKPFTTTTYNETIANYLKKIKSGEIKKNESILISIDTHGAPNSNPNVTSHHIATGVAIHHSGNTVAIDNLSELIDAAYANGIKIAIVDLSCHSGNTLKLAKDKACIVSATGPDHYGFKGGGTFSESFIDEMKPGKSIEDAFLNARIKSTDRGFPMISTDENKFIYNNIYPGISPYLFYKNESGKGFDIIDQYLLKEFSNEAICKRENAFNELLKIIKLAEDSKNFHAKILGIELLYKQLDLGKFKLRLERYKKNQDQIIKEYNDYKIKMKESVELSYLDEKGVQLKTRYTLEELFANNYLQLLKKELELTMPNKKLVNLYNSILLKQNAIKLQNPKINSLSETIIKIGVKIKNTQSESASIALDEKKLFQVVYELQRKVKKISNPCRDFIL